ncbi:MAG TPA: glycoside hydrolase family 127 protein [Verrucomicrobiae bacterium]|nr:glycoside hydrolase family 127 protein [Verrucomicrobiae bacterium]
MRPARTCFRFFPVLFLMAAGWKLAAAGLTSHDYPFRPVPFTAVHLDDAFWAPRIETNRAVTIPYAFGKCEESGRMDNFERAAAVLRGENIANRKLPGYPFDDTDPYKVLEGASYALAVQPDPKTSAYLDSLIALFAAAQEPDGYLYTIRTIDPQHPNHWDGPTRWLNDPQQSHELYDAGHLFEAAAAHYQATGETNLLNVALKEANLLCQVFGPGTNQLHLWPGHEIVEMGLAKLYRVTGDRRYLDLARYFIDVRGSHPGGDDYHQSRIPPVDQTEAVGHAVRAGYLYSGMADVAALTGDRDYVHAIDAIWENVAGKKLYLTGGIGSVPRIEGFGPDYSLPNRTAYCETCAAVANDYWNARLFELHGDARYVDVFERTLYNGLLSGVSLDGTTFFYPNVLESDGTQARSPWFGCACCPGNITRFLPSVPGYVYAQQGETIYVNLYAGGNADIKLDNRVIKLTQETRYPWDGEIKITVTPDKTSRFAIAVRIPGWARNEPVPSDLYRFADTNPEPVTLSVNGKPVGIKLDQGYVRIDRLWKPGDEIGLNLPMPVRRVVANDKVNADRGRVALQRGPIVFCAEWPDNPGGKVRNLVLPDGQPLTARFEPGLLNGVETIAGKAFGVTKDANGQLMKTEQDFKAIPYFAWANRGKGEMEVWLAEAESSVTSP